MEAGTHDGMEQGYYLHGGPREGDRVTLRTYWDGWLYVPNDPVLVPERTPDIRLSPDKAKPTDMKARILTYRVKIYDRGMPNAYVRLEFEGKQ